MSAYQLVASKALEFRLSEVFRQIGSTEFRTVLIKGWAVGRFYPKKNPRISTDIDIVVDPNLYLKLFARLNEIKGLGIAIDLHNGFGDRDPLPFDLLFFRSQVIELNGISIRVLSDEDNLRLTASHWLIDGGVYREKLWDIYYLVNNRKKDFDWDLCLNAAGRVRRTWVLTAIATAKEYLNLDLSNLPQDVRSFELPSWYKRTLEREWKQGPYLRMPITIAYRSPKHLFEQFRRRFPPNAIAATCDTESPFDDSPRWPLQLKSLRKRLMPYLRRS